MTFPQSISRARISQDRQGLVAPEKLTRYAEHSQTTDTTCTPCLQMMDTFTDHTLRARTTNSNGGPGVDDQLLSAIEDAGCWVPLFTSGCGGGEGVHEQKWTGWATPGHTYAHLNIPLLFI